MFADDTKYGQEVDHNKHSRDPPDYAPGKGPEDDHKGIDLDIIPDNIRSENVILGKLDDPENQKYLESKLGRISSKQGKYKWYGITDDGPEIGYEIKNRGNHPQGDGISDSCQKESE